MDYSINLGTAGWGVWHSPDAGKSWVRHRKPFPLNSRVQALVVLPGEPNGLLAAGDTGLFGSHDGGASWARIGTPGDLPTIWSLAVDPADPLTLFAGTRPAGIYRSRDGGQRWEQLGLGAATECAIGKSLVTRVLVDSDDTGRSVHLHVWPPFGLCTSSGSDRLGLRRGFVLAMLRTARTGCAGSRWTIPRRAARRSSSLRGADDGQSDSNNGLVRTMAM